MLCLYAIPKLISSAGTALGLALHLCSLCGIDMLILWSNNAGLYSHIHNESPLREDVAKAIKELQTQGKKFFVHCWDSMYEGYCSDMGIIDDETLEEIYVHYDFGQAFGPRKWWIEVCSVWQEEYPGCGYTVKVEDGWTIKF